MRLERGNTEFETLSKELNDPETLRAYQAKYAEYRPALIPRLLGHVLIWSGNLFYGKDPSYMKFRAIEVIARVPYHSWASASYTLLTLFYTNEKRAMALSNMSKYAREAQDNETMHVVVISCLAAKYGRGGVIRHTIIPMLFAFVYFWASYLLYLVYPRYSFELNYLFENHAFVQYSRFLEQNEEELMRKGFQSTFLEWYGRYPRNEYEFFLSVRNDEIIHRNTSIEEMKIHLGRHDVV